MQPKPSHQTGHLSPQHHLITLPSVPPTLLRATVVVLLAAGFVLHGLLLVSRQRDLDPMDTTAYLNEAHFIAENGGPGAMVKLLLTGRYSHANRQPLYPWLLSFLAVRDFAFLPRAKLVSLTAGLAAFLVAVHAAWRLTDGLTAVVLGLMLILSTTFLRLSSMVACESLLVLWTTCWWWFTGRGLWRSGWRWPIAGAMAGLAFLTKGTGLMLPGIALLAALIGRRRLLRSGWFWLFLAGFTLTTWPLLVRNLLLFGNPFHNVNSATMWADHWSDTYRPGFWTDPPGPLDYLRNHSAGEVFGRLGRGLVGEGQLLFEALHLLHLPGLEVELPMWVSGVVVLALAVGGIIRDRRSIPHRLLALLTGLGLGVFFLCFAWYWQVVKGVRFLLPMVPMILFHAARGWGWMWERLLGAVRARWAAGCVLLLLLAYLAAMPITNPLTSYDIPPGYLRLRNWIKKNVDPNEPFVLGPTHIYKFEAYTPDFPRGRLDLPALELLPELNRWLYRHHIRTVVLDVESVTRNRSVFRGYLRSSPRGLQLLRPIPHWQLVEQPPEEPIGYMVFRVRIEEGRNRRRRGTAGPTPPSRLRGRKG